MVYGAIQWQKLDKLCSLGVFVEDVEPFHHVIPLKDFNIIRSGNIHLFEIDILLQQQALHWKQLQQYVSPNGYIKWNSYYYIMLLADGIRFHQRWIRCGISSYARVEMLQWEMLQYCMSFVSSSL